MVALHNVKLWCFHYFYYLDNKYNLDAFKWKTGYYHVRRNLYSLGKLNMGNK